MQAEAEAQADADLSSRAGTRPGATRRAEEVRELARRILRNLTRQPFRSFAALPQGSVLAAQDLRPADAALIQPTRFAGIITAEGGVEGHTAVMLRALGLPAVLGAGDCWKRRFAGGSPSSMAIQARSPSTRPRPAWRRRARNSPPRPARGAHLSRLQRLPATTKDGTPVELQANLELPFELAMIAESARMASGCCARSSCS